MHSIRFVACSVAFLPGILATQARSQAAPTATRALRVSAFAGVNGTLTGLVGGKNLGITAGADLSIRPFFSLEPSIEVRGTYPVHPGTVDAQENVLGGLRLAKRFGIFHPYGDILLGRGEIDYKNGGFSDPSGLFRYYTTVSGVIAPGGGVDVDLGPKISFKADAQFPRYSTPVTTSGNVTATSVTAGLVYRFQFGRFPGRR